MQLRSPLLLLILLAAMTAPLPAAPPFQRIDPPSDLRGSSDSVAQASDGVLYLGAERSLLRYDGARWERIALPSEGSVRSLLVDRLGQLWVGAYDRPGRLQRQRDGSERFLPLPCPPCEQPGHRLADIWELHEHPDGVFMQALHDVLWYDLEGTLKAHWQHPGRFGELAIDGNQVLLQFRGEGLKVLAGAHFEPWPGGEQFASGRISTLAAVGDGRWLIVDNTPRIGLLAADGQWQPMALAVEDVAALVHGRKVAAQEWLFSGGGGQLRWISLDGRVLERLRTGANYQTDLQFDRQGGLLVVDSEGIARLDWPPNADLSSTAEGLSGQIYRLLPEPARLLALSSSGVLLRPAAAAAFSSQPWTSQEAWDLLPWDGRWILAESYGLRWIDGDDRARPLGPDDLYPRRLLRSRLQPDRLWIGGEHGVALYDFGQQPPRLLRAHRPGLLLDSLAELDADRILLGSQQYGLWQAHWQAAAGLQLQALDSRPLASRLSVLAEGILLSQPGQLAWWRPEGAESTDLDGLAALLHGDETVNVLQGLDGERWAHTHNTLFHYTRERGWREQPAASELGAIHSLALDHQQRLLVGGSGRLLELRVDDGHETATPPLRLTRVAVERAGRAAEAQPLTGGVELAGGFGGLRFEVALADLRSGPPPQYRLRLRELSEDFPGWSEASSLLVGRLPAGDYHFEAEVRRGRDGSRQQLSYRFQVLPRWHEYSSLRLALALALLALASWWYGRRSRARLRRLRAHNSELDALVQQRTVDLERANRQLREWADQDGLTGVGNRRLFDAALQQALQRARQFGQPLALLMCDLDHFKEYNDGHGHLAGDALLRRLGGLLRQQAREGSVVARYGGEEFVVIAPGCQLDQAAALAERLRRRVAEELPGTTASFGYAVFDPRRDQQPEQLIERVDAALYRAKHAGRNRCEAAP